MQRIMVTGGAGFIGSCLVRQLLAAPDCSVLNYDKLTYAGHKESVPNPPSDRYRFVHAGIEDRECLADTLRQFRPQAIVNLAAESHVDRSIENPDQFVRTNVNGTFNLLEETYAYYRGLPQEAAKQFRFLHVSTDEVYGSVGSGGLFSEQSPYQPNSPYAASKAASDMFVRAFHRTYGLPTLLTHCSNNYGPYQLPEKLIPLMILRIAEHLPLPVYGDGGHSRDWLHVTDTCQALLQIINGGKPGGVYNIGGNNEISNLQIVEMLCDLVDGHLKRSGSRALIRHVTDRPGHDRRYAVDTRFIEQEIGWRPQTPFEKGLAETVRWYLSPNSWLEAVAGTQLWKQRRGLL